MGAGSGGFGGLGLREECGESDCCTIHALAYMRHVERTCI